MVPAPMAMEVIMEYATWNWETQQWEYEELEQPPEGWNGWEVRRDEDGGYQGLRRVDGWTD